MSGAIKCVGCCRFSQIFSDTGMGTVLNSWAVLKHTAAGHGQNRAALVRQNYQYQQTHFDTKRIRQQIYMPSTLEITGESRQSFLGVRDHRALLEATARIASVNKYTHPLTRIHTQTRVWVGFTQEEIRGHWLNS